MSNGEHLVESLIQLRDRLSLENIPKSQIALSVKHNPWFIPYFIQERLKNIQSWLNDNILREINSLYPYDRANLGRTIGLVTAGNIPLVGFQDILLCTLSGYRIHLKPSHKDNVIIGWILDEWNKILPSLNEIIRIVPELHKDTIDFLIATGSDTTAKFFEQSFPDTPKVIRGHRYSVAVLDETTTADQLRLLNEDIFLFGGFGCRNVSNIIVVGNFSIDDLLLSTNKYEEQYINPLFKRKLKYEKAKLLTRKKSFLTSEKILFLPSEDLGYAEIGTIRLVFAQNAEEANQILQKNYTRIQCVVNKGTDFGETQYPEWNAFPDGINFLEILTHLS